MACDPTSRLRSQTFEKQHSTFSATGQLKGTSGSPTARATLRQILVNLRSIDIALDVSLAPNHCPESCCDGGGSSPSSPHRQLEGQLEGEKAGHKRLWCHHLSEFE